MSEGIIAPPQPGMEYLRILYDLPGATGEIDNPALSRFHRVMSPYLFGSLDLALGTPANPLAVIDRRAEDPSYPEFADETFVALFGVSQAPLHRTLYGAMKRGNNIYPGFEIAGGTQGTIGARVKSVALPFIDRMLGHDDIEEPRIVRGHAFASRT